MNAPGVVVADTTPLNYLILIGRVEILASLFGEVMVPEAVMEELRHPKAPPAVCQWLDQLPDWLHIKTVHEIDGTIQLGKGESESISLALEQKVKVVLMDERLGRRAAEARGLIPIGTLNLIDLADEKGFIDGIAALDALRQTTFRANPELLAKFGTRMNARRH